MMCLHYWNVAESCSGSGGFTIVAEMARYETANVVSLLCGESSVHDDDALDLLCDCTSVA